MDLLPQNRLILVCILSLALLGCTQEMPLEPERSFWVWKTSDLAWVPAGAPLYLYQGDYGLQPGSPQFIKRGVPPSSALVNQAQVLLVRVYQREDSRALAAQLIYLVQQWQAKGVVIHEVQLDHDCPSSQLSQYADFVRSLNAHLAAQNASFSISVTGLVTWLADNATGLTELAETTSYIHFQLYNRFDPLPQLPHYLRRLESYAFPYKLGITTSPAFKDMEFSPHANHQRAAAKDMGHKGTGYKGTTVFLNK